MIACQIFQRKKMAKNRGRNKIKGKIVEKHVKKLGDVAKSFSVKNGKK
jgi:hypothetical protein